MPWLLWLGCSTDEELGCCAEELYDDELLDGEVEELEPIPEVVPAPEVELDGFSEPA